MEGLTLNVLDARLTLCDDAEVNPAFTEKKEVWMARMFGVKLADSLAEAVVAYLERNNINFNAFARQLIEDRMQEQPRKRRPPPPPPKKPAQQLADFARRVQQWWIDGCLPCDLDTARALFREAGLEEPPSEGADETGFQGFGRYDPYDIPF